MKLMGLSAFSVRLRTAVARVLLAPVSVAPMFVTPVFVALLTLALFPDSALGQGPCPATTGTTLSPVPLNQPFGGAVSCNFGGTHTDPAESIRPRTLSAVRPS